MLRLFKYKRISICACIFIIAFSLDWLFSFGSNTGYFAGNRPDPEKRNQLPTVHNNATELHSLKMHSSNSHSIHSSPSIDDLGHSPSEKTLSEVSFSGLEQKIVDLIDPKDFEHSDYAGYTEEALQELSDGGDLRATQILAMRLQMSAGSNADNLDRVSALWLRAIAEGANHYPHLGLAKMLESDLSNTLSHSNDLEKAKGIAIEILSYYELASLQGNPSLAISGEKGLNAVYGLDLSSEDVLQSREMATKLYRDLILLK